MAPGDRKSERFTVVTTRVVVERLTRAAALAGMSKSELAHDCLLRGLDGIPGVSDGDIEAAEKRQETWRESRGLA